MIDNFSILGSDRNQSNYESIKNKAAASSFEKTPTLFIGLGGTGKDILLRLRENLFIKYENEYKKENPLEFLYYDLDQSCNQYDQRGIYTDPYFKENIDFSREELLLIKPDLTRILSKINEPEYAYIKSWLSEGLEAIDVKAGAGQQRQVSRLSFFSEFNAIREKIEEKIKNLQKKLTGSVQQIKIVLIFSIAGGTGCGSFFDMAFLCKYLGKILNLDLFITSHVVFPSAFRNSLAQEILRANAYAALKEIEKYMAGGNHFKAKWRSDMVEVNIPTPIFNECYIITGERYKEPPFDKVSDVFDSIAEYLTNNIINKEFNAIINSTKVNCANYLNSFISSDIVRSNEEKHFIDLGLYTCKYSSYGISKIGIPSDRIKKSCSAKLAVEILETLKENKYEANKHDKNRVSSDAAVFASECFLRLDESSPRLAELVKISGGERTVYDEICESVKRFVSEKIGICSTEGTGIKLNTDVEDIILKLKKDIFEDKIKYSTNSSEAGELVGILYNNFDHLKHKKLELVRLKEKLFSSGMLIPDITSDYGIKKAIDFMEALENELNKVKEYVQKYKQENNFKNDDLKSWLKKEIDKITEAHKKERNKNDRLYKNKKKFEAYNTTLDESFYFPFSLFLKSSAKTRIRTLIDDTDQMIRESEEPFKDKLSEFYDNIVNKLTEVCKIELNVQVICELIDDYYKTYADRLFMRSTGSGLAKSEFTPYILISQYEGLLDKTASKLKARNIFFSNFKISQNQFLIKDGQEIGKGKEVVDIINEYYDRVADEFTRIPDIKNFTRKDKNKFNEYVQNWKKEFYLFNSLEDKPELIDFIQDIMLIDTKDQLEKLFNSLKKITDSVVTQKIEFNIFRVREGQTHILNRSVEYLKKLSEASV